MLKIIALVGFILISGAWSVLALWVQNPLPALSAYTLPCLYALLMVVAIGLAFRRFELGLTIAGVAFLAVLIWYLNLTPKNDRQWNLEVARQVDFVQNDTLIEVQNVRNFHWRSLDDYDVRWENRQYDLSKLDGVDLILSTWGMDKIAHTLLSFRFSDGQKLALSIEIRKEQNEQYSAIAGFFRKYELAFIAADEKDIIYTRSNIRGDELVYLYPLNVSKQFAQSLFLSYLQRGKALQSSPQWYNSLTSNCTTVIYDMVKQIEPMPLDYRMIASGLLPEYLHKKGVIDPQYSLKDWQKMALINPKTANFTTLSDQSSANFSAIIRTQNHEINLK